jgi:hypothetical protein
MYPVHSLVTAWLCRFSTVCFLFRFHSFLPGAANRRTELQRTGLHSTLLA